MLDRAVSELGASRVDSGEAFDEGRLQVAPAVAWLPSKLQSVGAPRRARPWRAHVISAQALCARGVTVTLCEGVSQRNPCSLSISKSRCTSTQQIRGQLGRGWTGFHVRSSRAARRLLAQRCIRVAMMCSQSWRRRVVKVVGDSAIVQASLQEGAPRHGLAWPRGEANCSGKTGQNTCCPTPSSPRLANDSPPSTFTCFRRARKTRPLLLRASQPAEGLEGLRGTPSGPSGPAVFRAQSSPPRP